MKEVMKLNSAKEFLQQIKRLDTLITCQQDEIDSLMAMLTRVTPVMKDDGSSGGGFSDKMAGGVAKIVDLRREIDRNIDQFADAKAALLGTLNAMKQADHVRVLYLRYFKYMTWEEIAEEMKYSYRGVCYLHGRALVEFERELKKNGTEGEGNGSRISAEV